MSREIRMEGFTAQEILDLSDHDVDALILCDQPLVFRAGTAEVLGQFRIVGTRLVVELAHIDGGGEGVLPVLWSLASRYARRRRLGETEWIVHAVTCAKPNLKLRRVLERKGFVVEPLRGGVEVYRLVESVGA
jgi:hypothetical protein